MAVVFTDSYTVGANTNINAYPSGSPDYSYMSGSGSNAVVNATSDNIVPATNTLSTVRGIDAALPTGDQEASASITNSSNVDSSGVGVRCAAATDNMYFSYLDMSTANEVQIWRRDAGTDVMLASADRGLTGLVARTHVFRATGTNPVALTLAIAATSNVTFNDSNANRKQTGTPGFYCWDGATIDNLSVDDLLSGTQYTYTGTFSGVGSLAHVKQIGKSIPFSGVGTQAHQKQIGKIVGFSGVGTMTALAQLVFLLTQTFSATGTATHTKQIGKIASFSAVGTATLTKQIGKIINFAATGTMLAVVSFVLSVVQSFSAVGTFVSSQTFIPFVAERLRAFRRGLTRMIRR